MDAPVSNIWEIGDVLIVDKMLCTLSRRPYTGDRKLVEVMADVSSRPFPNWQPEPANWSRTTDKHGESLNES